MGKQGKKMIAENRNRNKQKLIVTPDVIMLKPVLPEDMVEEAKTVMENSEIPPGETSEVGTVIFDSQGGSVFVPANDTNDAVAALNGTSETSNDLLEAATDPAAALSDDSDRHADMPKQSEAELVATIIAQNTAEPTLAELDERKDKLDTAIAEAQERPALKAYLAEPSTGPEVTFVDVLFTYGGAFYNGTKKFANQMKLRTIALGNTLKDEVKHFGNILWGYHIAIKKKRAAAEEARLTKLAEKLLPGLLGAIANMTDTFEKEVRRHANRMTDFEKQIHRGTKSTNNVLNRLVGKVEGQLDPHLLASFGSAVASRHMTKAVSIYRAITGSELADAKAAVEGMFAA